MCLRAALCLCLSAVLSVLCPLRVVSCSQFISIMGSATTAATTLAVIPALWPKTCSIATPFVCSVVDPFVPAEGPAQCLLLLLLLRHMLLLLLRRLVCYLLSACCCSSGNGKLTAPLPQRGARACRAAPLLLLTLLTSPFVVLILLPLRQDLNANHCTVSCHVAISSCCCCCNCGNSGSCLAPSV